MEMKTLPDVASPSNDPSHQFSALQWVGMNQIQIPLLFQNQTLSAKVTALVNLKKGPSRGIHMSRIYSLLVSQLANQMISNSMLVDLVKKMVDSQMGLSDQAHLSIQFDLPLTRQSLKSELMGHRIYPVQIELEMSENKISLRNNFEVLYSSTCPASTALSLEIWKETYSQDPEPAENIKNWLENLKLMPATPHAQRSVAKISVELEPQTHWNLEGLIHQAEAQLKTPVQSLVKRVDEQEFARLNGQNPMFCEDAARIIQKWLDLDSEVLGYSASFEHQESLHSHNAFARIQKKRRGD